MAENEVHSPRLRPVAGALLGALLLMAILPSTGCVLKEPPLNPKFYQGMWHWGAVWFYPDALFYIGYFIFAVAAIICGALRRSKFEVVGWALLGLAVLGMVSG
jgi:hypothetical protein